MTRTEFTPVDTEEQLAPLNEDGGVDSESKKAVKKRQGWDSKWQYIFMVISYAVGLGNVWRFPYLVQQNGGGAFLIPYLIMLFIEGMPLLYLEFAIGQRMQKGTVIVWNEISPFLGGIGIASAITSFNLAIYYNALIMWCFFYLFHSFQYPLPWATCPTETVMIGNTSKEVDIEECAKGGATSYFWYRNALDISPGMESPDGIKWKMLLCLAFAWVIVYACIWKGIKSSGKVVYFTATFPYIVLLIFFVRGVTLRGAVDGLAHMFTPKLEKLLEPRVWLDAATQIFFSFGLGFGGLIAFSSYNNIHNNCQRDTIVISLTNWFTALFASSVVFSVLGFKATLMLENCVGHNFLMWQETFPTLANISQEVWQTTYSVNMTSEVQNVWNCSLSKFLDEAASGTGLAFIIFTQAIVEFGPSAPFWSIIFFMMLLCLGMGSEFGTIEGFAASIYDLEPLPFITRRKWLVSAIICGSSFLIGLLFVLGSGSYWVALFDNFSGSFPLLLIAMMECVTIGWIYGVNKFGDDIEFMIGSQPNIFWKIIWKFVAPVVVAGLLVATLISYFIKPLKYEAYDALTATMIPRDYPWYAVVVAFVLVISSVGCIPGIAILRRLKILNWNYAKQIQSEEKGYTQSTAKFLRSATSMDDDNDGRSGAEAIVRPYTDSPEARRLKTTTTSDGAVTFTFKE